MCMSKQEEEIIRKNLLLKPKLQLITQEMKRRLTKRAQEGFRTASMNIKEIETIAGTNYLKEMETVGLDSSNALIEETFFVQEIYRNAYEAQIHILSFVDGVFTFEYKQQYQECIIC